MSFGPILLAGQVVAGIETLANAERIEWNALARQAQDELGRLHGPEVTLDGPTPYRAGDRVISARPSATPGCITAPSAVQAP